MVIKLTDIRNFLFEPVTTLKARLSEFNDLVWKRNQVIAITKNGKPTTVLLKFETFKTLLEASFLKEASYFDAKRLQRKKRDPEKEKWLTKFNQLGIDEKNK